MGNLGREVELEKTYNIVFDFMHVLYRLNCIHFDSWKAICERNAMRKIEEMVTRRPKRSTGQI